jgi:hypothetical protein
VSREQAPVQTHRSQADRRRARGQKNEDDVGDHKVRRQLTESLLERESEQKSADDLRAGLGYPQLLQNVRPISVGPFVGCFISAIVRVDIRKWLSNPLGNPLGTSLVRARGFPSGTLR